MKEYQEFLKSNLKTHSEPAYLSSHEAKALLALRDYPHIEKLLSSFGGSIFDSGIFRIHTQSIEGFLNEDLVTHREDTLVARNFTALKKNYGDSLNLGDCIGFNKLLFLGGEDELDNYELTDMEVYWEINYQVYCKIQSLPEEKLINKISFY